MGCYIIGGRGRLGRAIAAEYAGDSPILLDRAVYKEWSGVNAVGQISRYFEQHASDEPIIFIASGLLDPSLPAEDLLRINYILPKNIINAVSELGIKVVTFGTVMEGLIRSKNPYIRSKTELNDYVASIDDRNGLIKHIQLHTLYGIYPPSPFMFLGQILHSIQSNSAFRMTSGRQLREYHHLEDVAAAIRAITESQACGVIGLSHGKPVSLKEIAESVFNFIGKAHLLRLGELPEPAEENYDQIFQVNEVVSEINFRKTLPAVNNYMMDCLAASAKKS